VKSSRREGRYLLDSREIRNLLDKGGIKNDTDHANDQVVESDSGRSHSPPCIHLSAPVNRWVLRRLNWLACSSGLELWALIGVVGGAIRAVFAGAGLSNAVPRQLLIRTSAGVICGSEGSVKAAGKS
jgi:hypothetical protein